MYLAKSRKLKPGTPFVFALSCAPKTHEDGTLYMKRQVVWGGFYHPITKQWYTPTKHRQSLYGAQWFKISEAKHVEAADAKIRCMKYELENDVNIQHRFARLVYDPDYEDDMWDGWNYAAWRKNNDPYSYIDPNKW